MTPATTTLINQCKAEFAEIQAKYPNVREVGFSLFDIPIQDIPLPVIYSVGEYFGLVDYETSGDCSIWLHTGSKPKSQTT